MHFESAPVVVSRSQENAELLAEMIRVVFGRDPRDAASFAQYHASLDQGASLEGVLNGLLHSAAYREFEASAPVASPLARAFFVDELVRIQSGLVASGKSPIFLSDASPKPLRKIEVPTGGGTAGSGSDRTWGFNPATSPAQYQAAFASSTTPTLRRLLAEAVGSRMDGFSSATSPDAGEWYAELASRLSGAGVDFGVAQRNRTDVAYHREMFIGLVKARTPSDVRDRVLWESLNRYYRVLNHLDKTKESGR
jgi:hypothetical protein